LISGHLIFFLIASLLGAPFVPVSDKRLKKIIELTEAKPGIKIADLGSGDGRATIAFAKRGGQVAGYEINLFLVFWSRLKIKKMGLSKKASIFWKNFWAEDLSKFDLIFIYGIDRIMKKLALKLKKELKPGAKIISAGFPLPGWKIRKETSSRIFLYEAT